MYTGIVKNEGKHEIGEVTIEIKLVNKGHATGNVKGGNFYKPSGFFEFFGELNNIQKNLGLGGANCATMVQAAEKHLKIYNERFRRIRSPIQTSNEFIAIACARYNQEFYDKDKSMLDERVQKNKTRSGRKKRSRKK